MTNSEDEDDENDGIITSSTFQEPPSIPRPVIDH